MYAAVGLFLFLSFKEKKDSVVENHSVVPDLEDFTVAEIACYNC